MSERDPQLERAIERAGGLTPLAEALGITVQAVSQWKHVPVERVLAVSALTGLPPHELRPDIYPQPGEGRAA